MNKKKTVKTVSFSTVKKGKELKFDVSLKLDRFQYSQNIFISNLSYGDDVAPNEILKDGDFITEQGHFVLRAKRELFKYFLNFFEAKNKKTNEFLFILEEDIKKTYNEEFSSEFIFNAREEMQKEYDSQFKSYLEDLSTTVKISKSSGYDYFLTIENVNNDNIFIREYSNLLNKAKGDILNKYLKERFELIQDYGDYAIHNSYYLTIKDLEEVKSKCLEILEDREKAKIKKQEQYELRIKELALKAKEMGEMQILDSYSCECNDPREECNVDIITSYVDENGKIVVKRSHTW